MWTRALANALSLNCVLFYFSILFWFHLFVKKLIIRCYAKIILKLWKALSFHVNTKIDKTIEPLALLPSNSILDAVSCHP